MLEACLDVTVIICTRNRAASLGLVLRSMTALKLPARLSWEILVVDNGSEDDTQQIIASFSNVLPIVCVRETDPGLSHARNAGVRHARGKYIVWTDDDVRVDGNWLLAYAQAFEAFPRGVVFGGSSAPVLEEPTPAWFNESQGELKGLLAYRNPSGLPRRLTVDGQLPYGLNFAIRADEQRRCFYDPMLGVAPGRRRGGEELQVIKKILAAGAEGYWVPDARVVHVIPASRQTLEYVRLYYKAQGEASAILRELGGRKLGIMALLERSGRAAWHYLWYRLRKSHPVSVAQVRHFRKLAFQIGFIEYLISPGRRETLRH